MSLLQAEAGAAAPRWSPVVAERHGPDGMPVSTLFPVAEECPVTITYHGVAYAVMMATPADLADYAVGFSLAEGIAQVAWHVLSSAVTAQDTGGMTLDIRLHPDSLRRFLAQRRVRNRVGHGGCGVCGVEDFADALPMPHDIQPDPLTLSGATIKRALAGLRQHQSLARLTHGAHAAAWVSTGGDILLAREDIGRHNAMDKLVGGVIRAGLPRRSGFAVITSRASVEIVQKAVTAGFGALVAISAPTAMAVDWARRHGLTLIGSARDQGFAVFSGRVD